MTIKIDYSRDELITPFGLATLKDRYLLPTEKSPQEAFARASQAFASNDEHAQRIYDYASKLWFMFSTPILSNGGTSRGLPISCYLNHVPDSREGLLDHYTENGWLASMGGGIGGNWSSIRSDGASTSTGGRSTGVIPFMHVVDSEMLAFSQSSTRRGSYAAYLDISHPEIEEFILMRKPTGGDIHRKCLNLHHGVNLTDSFMQAVVDGVQFPLIDPHSKMVTKMIDARYLWQLILETRISTGEPYIHWIDESNRQMPKDYDGFFGLKIKQSNLCVAPETLILTDKGYITISDHVNELVNVWNGKIFSTTRIEKTNHNAKLITIKFSDGSELTCTEYHKFYLQKGYHKGTGKNKLELYIKPANQLQIGDRLEKFKTPVINGSFILENAYTQGFFTGDGCRYKGSNHIDLYHEKINLIPYLAAKSVQKKNEKQNRQRILIDNSYEKYFVPLNFAVQTKLEWLAGLCDSDGVVLHNDLTESIQISSIYIDFLKEVKLMLQTLGVQSKLVCTKRSELRNLPDGKGGLKEYYCQDFYRLLIGAEALRCLKNLGFKCYRLKLNDHLPNRNSEHFIKVVEIIDENRYDATYCFNEPVEHKGIFNGILTGNCSEIILPTNDDRTAVCCLSSVNLEYYDEWKHEDQFIPDLIEFLDNVITNFCSSSPDELYKARYSAFQERSLGLGAMGFHSYLQQQGIPFEGPLAVGINKQIFKHIKNQAKGTTQVLARHKGKASDSVLEPYVRNMHLLAIAPNASSSIICGTTSPSIEPFLANAFTHKTMSGSFLVKNKYLERTLQALGRNDAETWKSIITNRGSVQHLDFLIPHEKKVFKTAFELDQRWLVKHASDRQPYICQAQSLNLFFPSNVDISYLNEIHMQAWKGKLKTLYYLRSEAINKTEVIDKKVELNKREDSDECWSCQG